MAMIFMRSINVRACVRACVSFPFRCVSRIERCRLSIRQVLRGRPRRRQPFPNAECDCRTCVDSDLEVRLPGRTSRPLRSAQREGRASSLLRYSWKLRAREKDERAGRTDVMIKFNFEPREDAESTFSQSLLLLSLADVSESCEVYSFLFGWTLLVIFPKFAKLSFFSHISSFFR